jgi:hypothetical protein
MTAATTVTATFTKVTWNVVVTVATTGTGSGTVTSAPAGITCPGTCTYGFDQASEVVLTATPAATKTFTGWSGDCTGTGACTLSNLSAAKAVTATFGD